MTGQEPAFSPNLTQAHGITLRLYVAAQIAAGIYANLNGKLGTDDEDSRHLMSRICLLQAESLIQHDDAPEAWHPDFQVKE